MAETTIVSIPGKDSQGNEIQVRLEVPRIQPIISSLPRVPNVILANEGVQLTNPAPVNIKLAGDATGGAFSAFEMVLPPGIGMQLHRHIQDEMMYVVDGQLEVQVGEKIFQAGPGSIGNFTSNTPHGFYNVGNGMAKVITVMIPGGFEKFYLWANTVSNPIEFCLEAPKHGIEFVGPAFIINSIGMRLVSIMPGEFMMGSPDSDPDAHPDEKPQHKVRINRPFFIGMHQVTVGQFRKFVEETQFVTEFQANGEGSYALTLATGKVEPRPEYKWSSIGFQQDDRHPVVGVSWNDALKFCEWLGSREKRKYRLPTEAEWEYCCRAGSTTRFSNGDARESMKEVGNCADQELAKRWVWNLDEPPFRKGTHLPPYAEAWNDGFPFTAPVGSFKPNAWGLFDMHGNVGEFCSDWYDSKYYQNSNVDDPQGPADPELVDISKVLPDKPPRALRVVRGGVWLDPATGCRSADRQTHLRHTIDSAADLGFRVVWEF